MGDPASEVQVGERDSQDPAQAPQPCRTPAPGAQKPDTHFKGMPRDLGQATQAPLDPPPLEFVNPASAS